MRQVFLVVPLILLLAGCAALEWPRGSPPVSATAPATDDPGTEAPESEVAPVPPAARTVEEFDTATQAQKAEAAAAAAAGGGVDLGVTIASLGSPSEPGFWLKTPLVTAPAKGRATYPATGQSVQVDLIPIDGPKTAGSRMSLSAMRLIGAPFTGLPEIRVYRIGG